MVLHKLISSSADGLACRAEGDALLGAAGGAGGPAPNFFPLHLGRFDSFLVSAQVNLLLRRPSMLITCMLLPGCCAEAVARAIMMHSRLAPSTAADAADDHRAIMHCKRAYYSQLWPWMDGARSLNNWLDGMVTDGWRAG
jgi:hypothetical protein